MLLSIAPGRSVDPDDVLGVTTDECDGDHRVVVFVAVPAGETLAIFIVAASAQAALDLADEITININAALNPTP